MAETRTRKTDVSVAEFIAAIPNDTRRADAAAIIRLMQKLSGKKPKMWGPTTIGFDRGKGCLYINKLAEVDLAVLEQLTRASYAWMVKTHRG